MLGAEVIELSMYVHFRFLCNLRRQYIQAEHDLGGP